MKKNIFFFAFIIAFKSALAQPPDYYILNLMNNGYQPGIESVIIKDGNLKWDKAWGYADIPNNISVQSQHIFMLGSISKTLIATALMQLWEQGAFQLDDDINLYLPFQVHHPNYPNDIITIRMLTAHTSGLCDDWNKIDIVYGDSPISIGSFLFDYFDPSGVYYDSTQNFCSFKPGTDWEYSNVGTTLAAYIVEEISGIPFDQYCNQNIFQPLCMENTSFKLSGFIDTTLIARPYSWDGSAYYDVGLLGFPIYPAGLLRTSAPSLARFMKMYMQYGTLGSTTILDSSTISLMMSTQFPTVTNAYGQGIFFYEYYHPNGDILWGHAGGFYGCSTDMFFNYEKNTGVIVFGNGDSGSGFAVDQILDTLYSYGLTIVTEPTDSFPECLSTEIFHHNETEKNIILFPNPATDVLHLDLENFSEQTLTVSITNIIGEILMEEKRIGNKINININVKDLSTGVYILRLKMRDKEKYFKFIKS